MSASDPRVPLSLATEGGAFQLRLFDHSNNRIAIGSSNLELRVRPGIYRLVIDGGPVVDERYLAVGASGFTDLKLRLDVPSAAPVKGASTTHEYHAEPAMDLSKNPMRQLGAGGRLVVFVRSMSGKQRDPVDVSGLSLWNAQNRPLASGANDFKSDPNYGWSGFSADVNPGGYLLRNEYSQSSKRDGRKIDQSLWVEPNWTTIVFVPFKLEVGRPQPEFGSIYIVPTTLGFNAYDDGTNLAVEVALSGLRKGRGLVPDQLQKRLLEQKFDNPMLGIVGALALLQTPETDWKLFDDVRSNLARLLPHAPDVYALRVMGKGNHRPQSSSNIPSIGWPPMLRTCYAALIQRDSRVARHIIGEDSVADLAAARLLASGPWTQWRSIEDAASPPELATDDIHLSAFAKMTNIDPSLWTAFGNSSAMRKAKSVKRAMSSAIESSAAGFPPLTPQQPATPEAVRIADYLGAISSLENAPEESGANRTFDIRSISQGTGLPRVAVNRGLKTLAHLRGWKGGFDGSENGGGHFA